MQSGRARLRSQGSSSSRSGRHSPARRPADLPAPAPGLTLQVSSLLPCSLVLNPILPFWLSSSVHTRSGGSCMQYCAQHIGSYAP